MRLYAESEELLYKMCNDKNDPIREGAINKDFKGLHLISAMWRNGMAAPSSKKILKNIIKIRNFLDFIYSFLFLFFSFFHSIE